MIKKLALIALCVPIVGCAWVSEKLHLREPTCLEKVDIAVKTQKTLIDTAIALREADVLSSGAKEEVAKSLDVSISLTDTAEKFCAAEMDSMAETALEQAKNIYKDVCSKLELTDKTYCKVLQ